MPELAEVETPKTAGFVDRGYNYEKKRLKLEEEEKEIARLEAAQRGESTEEDESQEEEAKAQEADSEVEEGTLSPEERSFKKRYGDLRRHMQEKEKEWNEKFEAFEKRMVKESIVPPKSDEDIEEWAKQYPDVAGIVETIAAKKAQEMFSKADARLQELDKAQSEAERVKAENAIRKAHEDFDDLRASDEFHNWAEEQPSWVQNALYENEEDARAVIRVLDLYKADKGLTSSAKKAKTKEAASLVSPKNKANVDFTEDGQKIYESQVAKMNSDMYAKNEDKIMAAIRSGNFVYDVSGGAR